MSKEVEEFSEIFAREEGYDDWEQLIYENNDESDIFIRFAQSYADKVKQDFLDSVSDDDILKGAIQQDSMKEQISWGEGATWVKEKLHNLKQIENR